MSVSGALDNPTDESNRSGVFDVKDCNTFLKRVFAERIKDLLQKEDEMLVGAGGERAFEQLQFQTVDRWNFQIRLVDASQKEAFRMQQIHKLRNVTNQKIGFYRVFEALGKTSCPIVAHNGFLDLLFIVDAFIGLPDTLGKFKEIVQTHFPNVFDTKWIGSD